jgi:hypothetical protein
MAKKRRFTSMTEMEEFFRKTGSQGGKKRSANMTQEQRSESARKAVKARWAKKKKSAKAKAKKGQ